MRTLFAVQVVLALYDITSTYFEGAGPPGLARHGHSRDQRPRERQVVPGLVLVGGWPLAHHVFAGNRKDATTGAEVAQDLRARFGLQRIVFVGDRGMVDSAARTALEAAGCGYLLGLPRRRNPDVEALLAAARRTPLADWEPVPGPSDPEAATRVLEVPCARAGKRWFAVHSPERLEYERAQRERERLRAGLERLLQKHHGRRHFQVQAGEGEFSFRSSARAAGEIAGEGHYCLETTEPA